MKIEIHRRKAETVLTNNGRDGYDVDDRFWFRIVADNGQILATSEMYTAKHNAISGATAIVEGIAEALRDTRNATAALIVDLTT